MRYSWVNARGRIACLLVGVCVMFGAHGVSAEENRQSATGKVATGGGVDADSGTNPEQLDSGRTAPVGEPINQGKSDSGKPAPSTASPSTASPSTASPSTASPSTASPSTASPTTVAPSTATEPSTTAATVPGSGKPAGQGKPAVERSQTTGGGGLDDAGLLAVFGLAFALVLALILNIYLLRWRKLMLSKAEENTQIVLPEVFWSTFERQQAELAAQRLEVENLRKAFSAYGQHQAELSRGTKSFIEAKMQELITNFIALQGPLDAAEAELKRYKDGYDHKIYKHFLERFIVKVALEVETEVNDPNEDSLAGIQFVLNDLLDEFDVERFEPDLGADYRSATGIADNPKQLKATSADVEFTIADVLRPGYRLRTPEGSRVIVPARVSVYGAWTEGAQASGSESQGVAGSTDGASVTNEQNTGASRVSSSEGEEIDNG